MKNHIEVSVGIELVCGNTTDKIRNWNAKSKLKIIAIGVLIL